MRTVQPEPGFEPTTFWTGVHHLHRLSKPAVTSCTEQKASSSIRYIYTTKSAYRSQAHCHIIIKLSQLQLIHVQLISADTNIPYLAVCLSHSGQRKGCHVQCCETNLHLPFQQCSAQRKVSLPPVKVLTGCIWEEQVFVNAMSNKMCILISLFQR